MLYRIFIPALEPTAVSMTLDVEATNWMLALRLGLDEIGADREIVQRAICDIKPDKTIHVMEPVQGRVFVLREIPAGNPTRTVDTRGAPELARIPTERLVPNPVPVHHDRFDDEGDRVPTRKIALTEAERRELHDAEREFERSLTPPMGFRVDSATMESDYETSVEEPSSDPMDYPLSEAELEKYFEPPKPGRAISSLDLAEPKRSDSWILSRTPTTPLGGVAGQLEASDDADDGELMVRVFEEMSEIEGRGATVEQVLEYALQRAVALVPSAAGWLLLADNTRRDLYFAAAIGTKAREVIDYRVPFGKGIAGFCATNGVSLTLSDVDQDPRFQSVVSRQVGLEIRSVACAPIQHEGQVYGALQVMNHRHRSEYTPGELDAVSYIARRVAEHLAARGS